MEPAFVALDALPQAMALREGDPALGQQEVMNEEQRQCGRQLLHISKSASVFGRVFCVKMASIKQSFLTFAVFILLTFLSCFKSSARSMTSLSTPLHLQVSSTRAYS